MSQTSELSGKRYTTIKGGKDAPGVELPFIVNEFSKYFEKFSYFVKTAEKIKKKYNIEKDKDGFWEDDDIKRVWGKTTRLNRHSKRRKTLCLVTMLEMLKKLTVKPSLGEETETQPDVDSNQSPNNQNSNYEEPEPDTEQTSSETCYIRIPLSVMEDDYDPSDDKQLPETASKTEQAKINLPYKLINAVPSLTKTMKKTSFVLQYNNHTRNATWGFEILNKDTIKCNASRSKNFTQDPDVSELFRTPEFLKKIKEHKQFNRGHVVPAGNHKSSKEASKDTNLLSNIVPQNMLNNGNIWEKLEDHCRKLTNQGDVRNVLVYTGPLYYDEDEKMEKDVIHIGEKVVPTHLFKVIIVEYENKPLNVECYRIPNEDVSEELNTYIVPLMDIEVQSGVLFSEKIPTIKLEDETVTVRFKQPDEKIQNEMAQNQEEENQEEENQEEENQEEENQEEENQEEENQEEQNKGIEIILKVTPYKNVLFGSIV